LATPPSSPHYSQVVMSTNRGTQSTIEHPHISLLSFFTLPIELLTSITTSLMSGLKRH
jgi:hypothetical protein